MSDAMSFVSENADDETDSGREMDAVENLFACEDEDAELDKIGDPRRFDHGLDGRLFKDLRE